MIKIYLIIGTALLTFVSIGGAVWKWNSMVKQITTLEQDNKTLIRSNQSKQEAIDAFVKNKDFTDKIIKENKLELSQINSTNTQLKQKIKSLNDQLAIQWKRQTIPESVLEVIQND